MIYILLWIYIVLFLVGVLVITENTIKNKKDGNLRHLFKETIVEGILLSIVALIIVPIILLVDITITNFKFYKKLIENKEEDKSKYQELLDEIRKLQ